MELLLPQQTRSAPSFLINTSLRAKTGCRKHLAVVNAHRCSVDSIQQSQRSNANWRVGSEVRQMYPITEGKVAVLTGGGGSLGSNVGLQLAKLGVRVILADVNLEAAAQAASHIQDVVNRSDIASARCLDLASLDSVRDFSSWLRSEEAALDILINNAGANFLGVDPWYTEDGIAGGPQVNVVGPFVLTRLLEPMLKKGKDPRVINVASVMHRFNEMPPPDTFMRDWRIATYGKSKLGVVMLSKLMQDKWKGNGIACVCVDPGAVYTGIWRTSKLLGKPPGSWLLKALYSPPEDALACCLHAAATDDLVPSGYYARGLFSSPLIAEQNNFIAAGVFSLVDWPLRWLSFGVVCSGIKNVSVSPEARDTTKAQNLWDYCSQLGGIPR